MINIKYSNSI